MQKYPEHAGHTAGSTTSKAAADNVERRGKLTRGQAVYNCIAAAPCTAEEIANELRLPHEVINPRVYEMAARGLIAPNGETRTTKYGNQANVYKTMVPYSKKSNTPNKRTKGKAAEMALLARTTKVLAEVVATFSSKHLDLAQRSVLLRVQDLQKDIGGH